ncbi:MAG: cytochrome c nitrite reductase small subunit [Candidatus Latescibacteria bacterium]|nr:cytochrome c nitrite reductase small subunit [Candidatus Latescibacterota bacterium]
MTPEPGFDWRWKGVCLALLLGIPLGLGAFTFHYGEGLSYFSTDPQACANCHIMQPQFDSWQKASHHTFATCIDCHLPHSFIGKYWAKAENGYNHSKAFTLQNFAEPILINEKNRRILQENCLACHDRLVDPLIHGGATDPEAVRCVHCHRSVGHGESVGLGGPQD